MEMLDCVEESCSAGLAGNRDQYRALAHRARTFLRKDKERNVMGLAEEVEDCLNANDLHPAYRALKKLSSKFTPRVSSV